MLMQRNKNKILHMLTITCITYKECHNRSLSKTAFHEAEETSRSES